ncbi:unnamed protein product [Linum trigynum]|uniref:Uncharacterized protein n=1 Tax=Linum trigynum TaxID=586398 RepID=A0AAV2FIT3_9ROSI
MVSPKEEGGMGFQDLRGFNIALLGKQLWNLVKCPDSLIARILKAKYHKRSSILDASMGYRPSFVWRSIMSAQELINKGVRWRIGNGVNVRIWGDRWIPTLPGQFVPTAPMGLPVEANVCELVDPDTNQWDIPLLESCFTRDTVEAISQIPLRGNEEVDTIMWHNNKEGNYSVREGYKEWSCAFKEQHGVVGFGEESVWKKLWSLQVPPKVRQFMWRFGREILPTGVIVSERNPRWGDRCPFCDQVETQVHLFSECQWASRICRQFEVVGCFARRGSGSCYEWFKSMAESEDEASLESWCVLLWYLWKERNAHMFNGAKLPEEEIPVRTKYFLMDYKQHQHREEVIPTPVVRNGWRKPTMGRWSVCTDAGVLPTGDTGLGVVIRDADAKFKYAAAKNIAGKWSSEEVEALAMEMGVQLAYQFQVQEVMLESDCLSVIK